ncbi:MAG: glycosyltransferase [Clostridia bacterium]
MRVLQISDSLKQRFGITSFLMNYNENIDLNKVIFDYLILDSEEEIENKIKMLHGNIYFMPKLSLKNIFEFKRELNSFFKLHQYDIVHSHFYQIDCICSKIAKNYGIKHYISHSHNTKYSDYRFRAVRNYIMALPIRYLSTDFCACSKNAGRMLFGSRILNENKLTIVPNAISYDKYYYNEKVRNKLRLRYNIDSKIVLGNIGSLKPQKNQLFLLKVIAEIKKLGMMLFFAW